MRKADKNTQDIDFVITWVDGNDLEWKREKVARLGHTDMDISVNADDRKERYRDWDNLRYWFRGVEKYAPWVHKIYFVTCGQKPDWLNENHDKLVLVNHEDYIPHEYLPTFSANPIELNFHRIKATVCGKPCASPFRCLLIYVYEFISWRR